VPETILFEKSVTLKDGSVVNIRERTRDEGTILMTFLQYLMKKIAENGDLDYPTIARQADELSRTLRERFVFIVDARVGKEGVGHGTLMRHPSEEEQHVADVSIMVKEATRGKGLGKALLEALLEYGPVKIQGMQKVLAKVQGTNDPAAKLCINAGFSIHGIIPGKVQSEQTPVDLLLFVRDLAITPELLNLPEDGKRVPKYFPHWYETTREREEKLILIGFLSGFDIERYDEVDDSGMWDWASRFALALADRDPVILDGRTRVEFLQDEALRIIPIRYLRVMAKALGYVAMV
jgi:L-amino acid N-acyltransferase YncA